MTPFERAERAKQLLDDAVLKAAFRDIREGLVATIEESEGSDVDGHHEFALLLKLLRRLQVQLQAYADELTVDKRKQEEDGFIQRARETIHDLMPRRRIR